MKRTLSVLIVALMISFAVLSALPTAAFALSAQSTVQRTTKLDLTGYTSSASSTAEGWAYNPTGSSGSPLLTLNSYGLSTAHSAPILAPANTTVIVNGDCYIDNALMGADCDVLSGSCDGYLRVQGTGTLNLYAEQYDGYCVCAPMGGVNDTSEVLYIDGITLNCYAMERTGSTAATLEECVYGHNGMELTNATINTYEGGCGIYVNGYLPIGGVTEATAMTLLIDNCNINIQNVSGDQWGYAKGIIIQYGHLTITNSNIVINAGSTSLWSYFTTTISGSSVSILSTPLSSANYAALVYCKRLVLDSEVEHFYVGCTRYTMAVPVYCTESDGSSIADNLEVVIGSFSNGAITNGVDSTTGFPAFEVSGNYVPPVTHTVNFVDWDGSVLSSQTVNDGAAATAPVNPSRVGYTFTGWDTAFDNVTADLTVTAQYTINSYTVTFVDWNGLTLSSQIVTYGSSATAPSNPVREGYTFTGWDIAFSSVSSDMTITAVYSINHYTVTFVDWDGAVLSAQTVEYGSAAIAPADPSRAGYTFTGWDVDFSNVASDLTVTAQYSASVLIGDVNCDGIVSFADVSTLYASIVSGAILSAQGTINADVNQDGIISFGDVSALYNLLNATV